MTAGGAEQAAPGEARAAAPAGMPAAAEPQETAGAQEAAEAPRVPSTGLGVDIVEISRMERILGRSPAFATRNFSEEERAYCDAHARPAAFYATHFAAKEAVLKALGTGFSQGIGTRDVEVVHQESGRPLAVLHGRAKEVAEELGVEEIPLSLSRSHETAVANAVALTRASRPVASKEKTPRQELAERFKELRGLLDEVDGPSEGRDGGVDADGGAAGGTDGR